MKRKVKKSMLINAILFLVLAAAVFYYFNNYVPGLKERGSSGRMEVLPGLVKEDITGLSISFRNGTNRFYTDLEYIKNAWYMKSPYKERADEETVMNILNDLPGFVSERVLTGINGKALEEYGFNDPVLTLVIHEPDSNVFVMKAGSKTPVGGMVYLTRSDQPDKVYLVYDYKLKSLKRTGDEFRDRDIFHIDADAVDSLEIIKKGRGSFILKEKEGNWIFTKGNVTKRENSAFIKDTVLGLLMLRAESFIDGPPDEKLSGGLKDPVYKVILTGRDHITNSLIVGRITTNDLYTAFLPERKTLVFINRSNLDQSLNMDR